MNLDKRVERLRQSLRQGSLDAFLISHPIDLYYFTGKVLSIGKMLVTLTNAFLFVDGRYYTSCQSNCPVEVMLSRENDLLEPLKGIKRLGLDVETTTLESYLSLLKTVKELRIELSPTKSVIKEIRAIKEKEELMALKEAASLGSEGFDFLLSLLKEGISEHTLASELEFFWRKRGASGVAFSPIIAFNENSAMPHYRAGSARLKKNSSILIDIGVLYSSYNSDMTRVVFYGDPPKELIKIRDIVEEASIRALSLVKQGVTAAELDEAARSYIVQKGYGEFFTHSLGHGVGLEIHEWPTLKKSQENITLMENMVITIEPGIYIPRLGGVRLEDTVIVTQKGYEDLTKRPKTLSIPLC